MHPEDGGVILAGIGRYGPYVQHNGAYANLANTEEVFEVGLNRAVVVLAEKKAGGGRAGAAAALKELGAHPVTGKPVRILSGRYGPYVKHEAVNANVPRGADPLALTLEEAVALLAAREGQGGGKKPAKRATAAKASASTPEAKKPGAKAKAPSPAKAPAAKRRPTKAKAPAAKKKAS